MRTLRLAADQGNALAQKNLGIMYENEERVTIKVRGVYTPLQKKMTT